MTMTIVIIVLSFVVALVIAVPMLMKARKAFGPSKKDVETINQLMATGAKARATVLAVTPTGMIVNNINKESSHEKD